jgi:nicotinate-nucleotide adenylyltransferase
MRIGIFGGTFDPVHLGHLIVAEQAREQARLDQVWFVPSARPPHKQEMPITPFDRRVEMLELATAGRSDFLVETIEKERPGPSFTVDTLADLKRVYASHDFYLILGSDCLPDFHIWREPQRIVSMAGLLVARRPDAPAWTVEQLAESLGLSVEQAPLEWIQSPLIEISSRDLRRRAAEGRSLRYLVPHAVEVLIREKKLYRDA